MQDIKGNMNNLSINIHQYFGNSASESNDMAAEKLNNNFQCDRKQTAQATRFIKIEK